MKYVIALFLISLTAQANASMKSISCLDLGSQDSCLKFDLYKRAEVPFESGIVFNLKKEAKEIILFNGKIESIRTNKDEIIHRQNLLNGGQVVFRTATGVDGGGG